MNGTCVRVKECKRLLYMLFMLRIVLAFKFHFGGLFNVHIERFFSLHTPLVEGLYVSTIPSGVSPRSRPIQKISMAMLYIEQYWKVVLNGTKIH